MDKIQHASDCAVHNEPAMPAGPCDCVPFPTDGLVSIGPTSVPGYYGVKWSKDGHTTECIVRVVDIEEWAKAKGVLS